ncbi:MAG: TetR/AcrR family transcriptional regulator [Solirubrobacterales bacterium]
MKDAGTKGRESRSRLMQAAVQEFAARGYHDAKVSSIVQAAGLTQAAFYLYFPSKEAIFEEILDGFIEQLQRIVQAMGEVAPLARDQVPDQILKNLKLVFGFLGAAPEMTRIALYESNRAAAVKDMIAQAMAAKIVGNQAAGKVRNDLPAGLIAECILGMVVHLTEKWLLTGVKTPDSIAEEMAPLLLHGIMNPK